MRMMRVQIPPVHPVRFWIRVEKQFHIPNKYGTVAERRMHFAVDEDDDGSSPFDSATFIKKGEQNYVCAQKFAPLYVVCDLNFQLSLVRWKHVAVIITIFHQLNL